MPQRVGDGDLAALAGVEALVEDRQDMDRGAGSHGQEQRRKDLGGGTQVHAHDGHAPDRAGNRGRYHDEREQDARKAPKENAEEHGNDEKHEGDETRHVPLHGADHLGLEDRRPGQGDREALRIKTVRYALHRCYGSLVLGARQELRGARSWRLCIEVQGIFLPQNVGRVGAGLHTHESEIGIHRDQQVSVERMGERVVAKRTPGHGILGPDLE